MVRVGSLTSGFDHDLHYLISASRVRPTEATSLPPPRRRPGWTRDINHRCGEFLDSTDTDTDTHTHTHTHTVTCNISSTAITDLPSVDPNAQWTNLHF